MSTLEILLGNFEAGLIPGGDNKKRYEETIQDIKDSFKELVLDQPMIGMEKGRLDTSKVLRAIDEL